MKSNIENRLPFYTVIGRLFYAIAAADKTVRPEEVNQLKQLIESDWLPIDHQAKQIETYFNEALDQALEVDVCIGAFKSFKQANEGLFTDELKELIWKTASIIADVVARKNKSELVRLSQIQFILKS